MTTSEILLISWCAVQPGERVEIGSGEPPKRWLLSLGFLLLLQYISTLSLLATLRVFYALAALSLLLRVRLVGVAANTAFDSIKTLCGLDKFSVSAIVARLATGHWLPIPSARRVRDVADAIASIESGFNRIRATDEWRVTVRVLQFIAALVIFRVTVGEGLDLPFSRQWAIIKSGPPLWQVFWEGKIANEVMLEVCLDFLLVWLAWRIGFEGRSRWVGVLAIVILTAVAVAKARVGPDVIRRMLEAIDARLAQKIEAISAE